MKDLFRSLIDKMSHGHVRNYATPGLTSSLVGGGDYGHGCVRLLSSDRDTREWVTPHSHRFDFACLVLEGYVENILFVPVTDTDMGDRTNVYAKATLIPRNGGMGRYVIERTGETQYYAEMSRSFGVGDYYGMEAAEIHSIRFSRGARVLFFEGPTVIDRSVILEPFSDGRVVETFDVPKWMFDRTKIKA